MKFLQAPWRWEFISKHIGSGTCVFCQAAAAEADRDFLVCHRGEHFFVILNKFPYATGHLMVVPYVHTREAAAISGEQAGEMWHLINRSMAIIAKQFKPDGFNLGMNLGAAAGAGIKEHIHMHLVPRWSGDANFMPIIGKARVMSYDLIEVYDILAAGFRS
jgi:ATP adenylyltransferase